MIKNNQNEDEYAGGFMYSKFGRIFLIIVAMALIFAGPTYLVYILNSLNVNFAASAVIGFVVFIVGIVLALYLVRKKVITV